MAKPKYPECEKMRAVKEESQTIGEFLEWLLNEKQYQLGFYHTHDGCTYKECGLLERSMNPARDSIESLLAEYFVIDLKAVEREQRAMLEALRKSA